LRREGFDAWFVAVAPSDEFRQAVLALDAETRRYVRVLDRIDDPNALRITYGAFDVFLHVTRQGETFGNVLAEAQACEVPVVTFSTPSRDNSQCEVVVNGRTGFVVAKWSRLLPAIREFALHPALRTEFGTRGRAHVLQNFSSDVVIQRLLSILDASCINSTGSNLRSVLVEASLLSETSYTQLMASHLGRCYGGLPLSWAAWSRLDGSRGIGFRVARRIDHYRRRVAEQTFLAVDDSTRWGRWTSAPKRSDVTQQERMQHQLPLPD